MITRTSLRLLMAGSLAVICATEAGAQTEQLPPDVVAAFTDWNKCLAGYVQPRVRGAEAPEAVAEAALKLCEPKAQLATEVAVKRFGAGGRDSIASYRTRWRGEAVGMLTQLRSGAAPSDPLAAWSQCLGDATQKAIQTTKDAPTAIADGAFLTCQHLEAAAHTSPVIATGNAAENAANFALSRQTLRNAAIELATSARAKP